LDLIEADARGADTRTHVAAAIAAACSRIAPLWPLKHFVAVNPFLGFADHDFGAAAAALRRIAKTEMLMPTEYYLAQRRAGAFGDGDIAVALSLAGVGWSAAEFEKALAGAEGPRNGRVVATVADVLDGLADGDRQASRTAFMRDEISRWCAAYFDEGQAAWRSPWRHLSPFAAWREYAQHDRNPEVMGVTRFRETLRALPRDAEEAIAVILEQLGIPKTATEDYLFRALFDIQGWAAYARYRVWDNALYGREDRTLVELLAIRLAWGFALFKERTDKAFVQAWRSAIEEAAATTEVPDGRDADLKLRLVLQTAYEHAYQARLLKEIDGGSVAVRGDGPARVQAAFCIDVRSEVYRRALESVAPRVETLGFAGFFGFPIEYVPIGNRRGGAQCPVLLKPSVIVCEAVKGAGGDEETEMLGLRLMRRRAAKAWKAFKQSAVSSFSYVETLGLGYAAKIASDALGLTRPVPDPNRDGLSADSVRRLGPRLEPQTVDGRMTGFAPEGRVAMAEAVLRGMSLTENFARVIMLAGHGSTSINNPHASGLDCGACGGHTGEANARVAAALLNDPGVRLGLRARGIAVPADSWFVAALHNTTTDEVTLFDMEDAPPSHRGDLEVLREQLRTAAARARSERALLLGEVAKAGVDKAIVARSRDWSQVRPEWGLAGNAAFIAAPRARTKRAVLGGRSFLHTYDWRNDAGFAVLELIMTAPMVVATWINLQYFGSSVNNDVFGSGNKTLHNVVGALGVLEGNGGDLRVGLPLQSVHDGRRLVHEPMRLSVIIEAPIAAINAIIAKHQGVRDLVENRWLHLFAITETGEAYRYWGGGSWAGVSGEASGASSEVAVKSVTTSFGVASA
jgi:uncharacterized protein YbcC (UPF0753/DUF2309 family)